jgi:hypothetical protein
MPDPNTVSPGNNGGRINLQNAPGADYNFDDLFPNPEVTPQQSQVATSETPSQQTPQATENQPFLKAGNSVYLTAEEAAKGIEHKDALVTRYRDFLAQQGFDPNELRPKAAPQVQPQVVDNFDSGKLFDELASAAQRGDKAAYGRIQESYQRKIAQDVVQNVLAPYAPLMAETARQRAIREVSAEIPDFPNFIGSEAFRRVSDSIPIYKDMLQLGENNPEASKRLPEVYKSMYLVNQGLTRQAQVSQPQAQQVTAPPVQNTPTGRPQQSLTPSTLTPPNQSAIDTRNWSYNDARYADSNARKQLIKDSESKGLDKMDWTRLGT